VRLVVVGDALLDRDLDGRAERLAPDAPVPVVEAIEEHPRAGGAGLAASLAAAAGADVTLVCALGDDDAGRRLAALLAEAGVRVCDLGLHGATPEKVRVRAAGRPLVRLDTGGGDGCGPLAASAARALRSADAVLVSDYGRGVAAEPSVRTALADLVAPVVWDPHPRGPDPVPGVTLATPNAAEAAASCGEPGAPGGARLAAGDDLAAAERAARALSVAWQADHVCVTRGGRGALLVARRGPALAVPAPHVAVGDPCGAGDAFAVAATARLAAGASPAEAVNAAVHAASAFVAGGGASAAVDPLPERAGAAALAGRVRARGGTVVATGGCFDLLHAGHVSMLAAARALGDCLIVCLNSDASVRRLKGPERPLVAEHDRAAVLAALASVDAVAVFAEDDPVEVLRTLRPHVWVKGGDYELAELPEAAVLAEWGARAVIVPYMPEHSTSRLIEVARVA
jgi:D-beta-D-heptose 7-phosphate kinase / D-beta-D-heptose 1-phosphate adenosyltransferase